MTVKPNTSYRIDFLPVTVDHRTGKTVAHVVTDQPVIEDGYLVLTAADVVKLANPYTLQWDKLYLPVASIRSITEASLAVIPTVPSPTTPLVPPASRAKLNRLKADGKR